MTFWPTADKLDGAQMPPNKQLQRTCQSVTHFACAKCAPLCYAAELRRYAAWRASRSAQGNAPFTRSVNGVLSALARGTLLMLLLVAGTDPMRAVAATTEMSFGRLTISVSDSWTAQVFHIVDQLSVWDSSAHMAYSRWARDAKNLDDEDRQLLARHAALRQARGWGNGFEQAFLVEDPIDVAAAKAVEANLLSAEEAAEEAKILAHFAPKLLPLRDQQERHLEDFREQLAVERQKLAPVIESLVRFAEVTDAIHVPVFIVANPEERSGGGEANGGRIVVEVPAPDALGALIHESVHILLAPRAPSIRMAAEQAGLSFGALNEGIAYAMAPGLTDDPAKADALAEQLARFVSRGTPASNDYVQSAMVALILRPELRDALADGRTLTSFLPEAAARWRKFTGQ
jgi:hypothetical protein